MLMQDLTYAGLSIQQQLLNATPTVGNGPFGYSWSPSTGLDNDANQSPTATLEVQQHIVFKLPIVLAACLILIAWI